MTLPRLLLATLVLAPRALADDSAPPRDAAPEVERGEDAAAAEVVEVVGVVPAGGDLAVVMAPIAESPVFAESRESFAVVRAADGKVAWATGDDAALAPASTMKLLTAATALRALGPSYRFPTWIRTDGELEEGGVLAGNLYVQGQGDPTMVVETLWRIVKDLELRGIAEVKGDVVYDDSYFAGGPVLPGWTKEEDLAEGPTYFAPLGALSVNYNIAAIVVRPALEVGQPAIAEFDTPTGVLAIDNHLVTGRARSKYWVKIERTLDEKGSLATYKLVGNVPADREPDTLYRALADPLGNYQDAFAGVMKAAGIKVKGKHRPGATPAGATLVLQHKSEPLADIVAEMNKHSNNFMAEQILRAVGAEVKGLPGTTEKGIDVVSGYLQALGVGQGDFHLVNGSGLSRETKLRPSQLNAVLVDMYRDPRVGPEFVHSLSVGGRDGTLGWRFRQDGMEGRVRGKTGTLDGVACLAGYVRALDGETYAFTFFVNDLEGARARARAAHDQLVLALAGVRGSLADGAEP